MSESAGDHVLMLRLWEVWQASGCSRNCCWEYGLDLRGMNFARDIRRQLEGVWGGNLMSNAQVTCFACTAPLWWFLVPDYFCIIQSGNCRQGLVGDHSSRVHRILCPCWATICLVALFGFFCSGPHLASTAGTVHGYTDHSHLLL